MTTVWPLAGGGGVAAGEPPPEGGGRDSPAVREGEHAFCLGSIQLMRPGLARICGCFGEQAHRLNTVDE